jgi:beta-lactam-binding protein with PASTA domain
MAVTAAFTKLPKKCVVPKLKGKSVKAAEHAIKTHDCRVGTVRRAFSRKVRKGHVISQNPRPSKRLAHGARINLVVSKGRH